MPDIADWKRAVVHLEAASGSLSHEDLSRAWRALGDGLRSGTIAIQDIPGAAFGRDVRETGTAVLVVADERQYLVTARHVVVDRTPARPGHATADEICSMIFREPTVEEALAGTEPEFLMNIGGHPLVAAFTFSAPELDLAVISLEHRWTTNFARDLGRAGFRPVAIDDLVDPPDEGTEIFSVGYPLSVAALGSRRLSRGDRLWASSLVSAPVFSFGHVAMNVPDLPFFWCDLSAYPGNSGGPIVIDGHLAGIVSEQAMVEGARIPFTRAIKATNLRPLLKQQRRKDHARDHGIDFDAPG